MASEVIQIIIEAVDKFSKTVEKANQSFKEMDNVAKGAIGAGLVAAGAVGVNALNSWAIAAAEAGDVQESFNKRLGEQGPDALKKFKSATLGTINNVESMKAINSAVARGIEADNIPLFAKYSQQLIDSGQASGDVTTVMNQLTNAYIKNKDGLLKTYGVQFDATQSLDTYLRKVVEQEAAQRGAKVSTEEINDRVKELSSSLTEAEKSTITQKLALEAIKTASEQAAEPSKDYADALKQIKADTDNLTTSIGETMLPVFDLLSMGLQKVIGWFNGLSENSKLIIGVIIAVTSVVFILTGAVILLTIAAGALNIALLPFIAIILAVIAVIVIVILIILKWKDILMFLWGVVLDVAGGMILAWKKFKDFWEIMWAGIKNVFFVIWNAIVSYYENAINLVIKGLNKIISYMNKIPGVKIPMIPEVDFSGIKADLVDLDAIRARQQTENEQLLRDIQEAKTAAMSSMADKIGYEKESKESTQPSQVNNINIENVNGTDPDQMSEALMEQLRKKISPQ
jgi:hypothetical protein